MRIDHDTSYKQLFAHPELVCELLAGFLPSCFAGRLDASACKRINGSYASDAGHQRHDDMVWHVGRSGESAGLYVLLEFQSQPDRWMALRMQVYVGLLYQDLLKQGQLLANEQLPPVLPVVVYSGERAWASGCSMGELRSDGGSLNYYQPELHYLLIDLVRQSDTELGDSENVVLALFQCTPMGTARRLLPALACVTKWLGTQTADVLRRSVTRWVMRHLRVRFKRVNIPWNCTLEEVHTMYARKFDTFEDQLMYEFREEYRQEGSQVANRRILTRLLERDIGPLSAAAVERVNAAGPDQLQEWLDQVIDGKRPEALLKP